PQRLFGVAAERPLLGCLVELVVPALVRAEDRPQARTVLHAHHEAAVGKLDGDQLGRLHRGSGGGSRRTDTPETFHNTGCVIHRYSSGIGSIPGLGPDGQTGTLWEVHLPARRTSYRRFSEPNENVL